jgi:hypothetical protein
VIILFRLFNGGVMRGNIRPGTLTMSTLFPLLHEQIIVVKSYSKFCEYRNLLSSFFVLILASTFIPFVFLASARILPHMQIHPPLVAATLPATIWRVEMVLCHRTASFALLYIKSTKDGE